MITREQAFAVGDEVVRQARDEELARKNASAAAVPHMYRFPELEVLERWERPILVTEARKYAMRQPKVIALWAVLSALVVCLTFIFIRARPSFPVLTPGLVAAVLLAPIYFYRREVMRTYIRRKVATLIPRIGAGSPGDG
jgi:hypothetical protein